MNHELENKTKRKEKESQWTYSDSTYDLRYDYQTSMWDIFTIQNSIRKVANINGIKGRGELELQQTSEVLSAVTKLILAAWGFILRGIRNIWNLGSSF